MSNSTSFSFKYVESGGLSARYQLISYDPETNTLRYSTDATGVITMDDNVHTTTWADTSPEIPEELRKIAEEIKKLIADKK